MTDEEAEKRIRDGAIYCGIDVTDAYVIGLIKIIKTRNSVVLHKISDLYAIPYKELVQAIKSYNP
jgi:hypothetical protein